MNKYFCSCNFSRQCDREIDLGASAQLLIASKIDATSGNVACLPFRDDASFSNGTLTMTGRDMSYRRALRRSFVMPDPPILDPTAQSPQSNGCNQNSIGCEAGIRGLRQAPKQYQAVPGDAAPTVSGVRSRHGGPGHFALSHEPFAGNASENSFKGFFMAHFFCGGNQRALCQPCD